jgi:hypothetical protein
MDQPLMLLPYDRSDPPRAKLHLHNQSETVSLAAKANRI